MNCSDTENYIYYKRIESLSEEKLAELYEHAEDCEKCNRKLALEPNIKSKLNEFYNSIFPSDEFKNRIKHSLYKQQTKLKFKTALIAASFIFLLGLGLVFQRTILSLPNIQELHSLSDFHIISNNIDDLSNHLDINFNKINLTHFNEAGYIPHGAIKVSKLFKKDIKLIALKNEKGNKVSLCFLPRSYHLPYHSMTEIKGIHVHHGKSNSYPFIFWQGNNNTIVLVSDNMSHEELINLAHNLIGEV